MQLFAALEGCSVDAGWPATQRPTALHAACLPPCPREEVLAEVRRLCPLSKPSDIDALFER